MVDRVEKANSTTSRQEFIRSLEKMKSWLNRIEKRRTEHTDNVQELKVALDLPESIKDIKNQLGCKKLAQRKDGTFQKRFTDLGLSGMSCRQIKYQEVRPTCQRQDCRKCRFSCVCCNPERESQE